MLIYDVLVDVVFANLLYLCGIVLFLKEFVHEILVLERFVIQTFRKILAEIVFKVINLRCLLVLEELQLLLERFLEILHFLVLDGLSLIKINLVDLCSKPSIPIKSERRKQVRWELVLRLLIF